MVKVYCVPEEIGRGTFFRQQTRKNFLIKKLRKSYDNLSANSLKKGAQSIIGTFFEYLLAGGEAWLT